MRKLAFALLATTIVGVAVAAPETVIRVKPGTRVNPPITVQVEPPSDVHHPLLRAATGGKPKAGKERIYIPVDGAVYQVEVIKPREPALIGLERS
jgi:hypothetical protein